MTAVGLTGGIGAGKSTVADLLAERGAVVIDADDVTRALQQVGEPVYEATVRRFGAQVVGPGGDLDRAALAALVFTDPVALADLEALTHPAVHAALAERVAKVAPTAPAVVLVVPLLLEVRGYEVAGVVVVDCPVETVMRRLAEQRGMAEAEVEARLARQLSRKERLARADYVIDNSGPPSALPAEVDRAWGWILARVARPDDDVPPPR